MTKLPRSLFISHGGGPLPLLGDPQHDEMIACLRMIAAGMPRPDAILVVSAHWEAPEPVLTASARPELIYDYYGFPPAAYQIQYPCSGEPALAAAVHRRLTDAGIDAGLDDRRGLDHGLFVPLKIMYPQADIPCVQLSLVETLSPAAHIDIGRALDDLHQQGVLVVGSGFSFHNLRAFSDAQTAQAGQLNEAFEDWLRDVCEDHAVPEVRRRERLERWSDAPGARFCHPREEHLLPLHVCYGAAQTVCRERFELTILNERSSMYLW